MSNDMYFEVDGVLTRLAASSDVAELEKHAHEAVVEYGFDGFTYHRYSPASERLLYAGDWNMAWVQRYEERGYVDIDPVAKRVINSVLPFCWNEILLGLPVNAPERAIFTEAKEFGLAMGADIPLHEPGFGAGSFSVFSSDETGFARAWNRYRHLLHVIAVHFHECHKVLHPDPAPKPSLTKRERECLAWLARGKTAWEIGEILGVTENTTRMYLNSAMKKLGANSRLQAVVKAMLTRQILP